VGVLAIPQEDPEKEAAAWEYLAELLMRRVSAGISGRR
jgi:hypothetical protein